MMYSSVPMARWRHGCPPVLLQTLHSHVKHLKHARNQTEFMLLEVFCSCLYNLGLYAYEYTQKYIFAHTM